MLQTLIPNLLLSLGKFYNNHTSFRRGRGAHARLICWGIKRLGFKSPLLRTKCGAVFEYSPRVAFDGLTINLHLRGEYEPKQTQMLLELLPRDGVFIDVGANMGYFSILAASRVGANGRVFAFEPAADIYDLLSRNIVLNRMERIIRPMNFACFSSMVAMAMECSTDSGKSHLVRAADGKPGSVPLITLDHFVEQENISRIDCIKVDAEGCDLEVLKGCRRAIERYTPAIIMETDHLGRFGSSTTDARNLFCQFRYSISELKTDNTIDFVCLPKK